MYYELQTIILGVFFKDLSRIMASKNQKFAFYGLLALSFIILATFMRRSFYARPKPQAPAASHRVLENLGQEVAYAWNCGIGGKLLCIASIFPPFIIGLACYIAVKKRKQKKSVAVEEEKLDPDIPSNNQPEGSL